MSRTIRRRGFYRCDSNLVEFINRELDFYPTLASAEADARLDWAKRARDGRGGFTQSRHNTDYKNYCVEDARRRDRSLCHSILRDEELAYEGEFSSSKHGKRFIWSVW